MNINNFFVKTKKSINKEDLKEAILDFVSKEADKLVAKARQERLNKLN